MIIEYGCVKLRAIEKEDFELLFYLINAPEIECKTVGWHFPVSRMAQRQWIDDFKCSDKSIKLMIELVNSKTIGMIMLDEIDWKNRTATFGCKISAKPQDRIKGDVLDATKGILKYAFHEMGMNSIHAEILEDNFFSQKLCRRVGLVEEGILRKRIYKRGKFKNLIVLSVLKEEFEEKENLGLDGY